jgi:hypothetical protein
MTKCTSTALSSKCQQLDGDLAAGRPCRRHRSHPPCAPPSPAAAGGGRPTADGGGGRSPPPTNPKLSIKIHPQIVPRSRSSCALPRIGNLTTPVCWARAWSSELAAVTHTGGARVPVLPCRWQHRTAGRVLCPCFGALAAPHAAHSARGLRLPGPRRRHTHGRARLPLLCHQRRRTASRARHDIAAIHSSSSNLPLAPLHASSRSPMLRLVLAGLGLPRVAFRDLARAAWHPGWWPGFASPRTPNSGRTGSPPILTLFLSATRLLHAARTPCRHIGRRPSGSALDTPLLLAGMACSVSPMKSEL